MRRRQFITLLGGAAATWPMAANAQQKKLPVIGILSPAPSEATPLFDAFRAGLKGLGYVEGRSVRLDFRLSRGQPEKIATLAAELVKDAPAVIIGDGAFVTGTLKGLTTTIPIVGILGPDPVASGLVASLARPGGNITGVSTLGTDLHPKRIELLKSVVPQLSRLAVLWDANNDPRGLIKEAMMRGANNLNVGLVFIAGGRTDVLEAALSGEQLKDADGVLVSAGPTHFNNREVIVGHIAASAKPAIYAERDYCVVGGLMSYGPNVADLFFSLARRVDAILKGAKARDIAVEQVTRIENVLNLKTAKALGLAVPLMVLAQADEVIE